MVCRVTLCSDDIWQPAPLSMIEGHFSNTLGFLWLSHGLCLQKLLMVKALWIFEVCHCLCTATKADLCRKKVTLGRNQPQEAITAVRSEFYGISN